MNFAASLSLPRDPREAAAIADNLESLARALRDWPDDAWRKLAANTTDPDGLFERLAVRTAPAAIDPLRRQQARQSAEAVASVLRVMWPEERPPFATAAQDELVAAT
jgi:hypothetical protein